MQGVDFGCSGGSGLWAWISRTRLTLCCLQGTPPSKKTWVVVQIMVSSWIPMIVRHLIPKMPQKRTIILTTTHMCLMHMQAPTLKPARADYSKSCGLGFRVHCKAPCQPDFLSSAVIVWARPLPSSDLMISALYGP